MNEKLTEEYWRVDFDTAKLLKEAGFDKIALAYYQENNGYFWSWANPLNHNKQYQRLSAPLISVAFEWCYELGYRCYLKQEKNSTRFTLKLGSKQLDEQYNFTSELYFGRSYDLAFIQACCKHRIEQLKQ